MQLYKFVFSSIILLINLYTTKYRKDDLRTTLNELEFDNNLPRIRVYDFIVVGGGGAGCVVASRLSKKYNVLLLEVGGTPPPATHVPYLYNKVADDTLINYDYTSVPQLHASLDSGGIIPTKPGKMLGGSHSHNAMVYNRGNPLDFDNWANITKDESWMYKNILKYFKKSEHFNGPGNKEQHGHSGLLNTETIHYPLLSTWLDAGRELGYKTSLDSNGPQIEAFTTRTFTNKKGKRVSTYTAFIKPFEQKRKKLRIERYSEVSEVLINDKKRAYGVGYTRHLIPQIAHASKEIIISSGFHGSPLLLIKSGIGPSDVLEKAGIPIVMDLPVGKAIKDHPLIFLFPITLNDTTLLPLLKDEFNEDYLIKYQKTGKGQLGANTQQFQGFSVSSVAKHDKKFNWPDLSIYFEHQIPINPNSITILVLATRPKSTGTLTLNTKAYKEGIRNNEKLAVIDYNSMSNPNDVIVMLEGIKLALSVVENTTAFQKFGAKFQGTPHVNCRNIQFRSDDYWRCYILQTAGTPNHLTSSCRMGYGIGDKYGVLDSKLNLWAAFTTSLMLWIYFSFKPTPVPKGKKRIPIVEGGLPIIGHGLCASTNMLEFIRKCYDKYGGIFQIKLFLVNIVVVCDSKLVPQYFKTNEAAFSAHQYLKNANADWTIFDGNILGHGKGSISHNLLVKLAQKNYLFISRVEQEVIKFVTNLKSKCGDGILTLTLNDVIKKIITRAGLVSIIPMEVTDPLVQNIIAFFPFADNMILLSFLFPRWLSKFIFGWRAKQLRSTVASYFETEIKKYRDDISKSDSILIRTALDIEEKKISDREIVEIILAYMHAFVGNAAQALTTTLEYLMLPANASILKNLREECQNCIGDMSKLLVAPLLNGCVVETYRLSSQIFADPKVPMNKDCCLGDYYVGNKVNLVMLSARMLQVYGDSSEIYHEPTKYIPERFIGIHAEPQTSPNITIFGGGRTLCPGRGIVSNIIKIALAHLILHFDFNLAEKLPEYELPTSGAFEKRKVNIHMTKRNYNY